MAKESGIAQHGAFDAEELVSVLREARAKKSQVHFVTSSFYLHIVSLFEGLSPLTPDLIISFLFYACLIYVLTGKKSRSILR